MSGDQSGLGGTPTVFEDKHHVISPLISPWYRRVLTVLSIVVVVFGSVAVVAERTASSAACKGANQAKEAVVKVIKQLKENSESPLPSGGDPAADATILAIRARNIAGYKKLLDSANKELADNAC